MYCIEVHEGINQLTSLFYFLRLWHRGEEPTVVETRLKLFYSMYGMLLPISLICRVISSDNIDESIFLVQETIISLVTCLNLFYIIWKKKEILELLNIICVYSTDNRDEFFLVNGKLKRFSSYVKAFVGLCYFGYFCGIFIIPFLGTERNLLFNIAFPLDWKNNEIAFWIAFAFVASTNTLLMIALLFAIIIWYVMFNCTQHYEILGHRIKNTGVIKPILGQIEASGSKRKLTGVEKHNIYLRDLIEAVKSLNHIRDLINQSESFFSHIFVIKLATSGLCICASIYSLVFSVYNNYLESVIYCIYLFYNIFEIFMLMYFGNEITLSSGRLSYYLFESNWVEQPESSKKYVIIFGELLKKPLVLVICKLYPLTLETFTRILKSAYSMFNILKDLNHK